MNMTHHKHTTVVYAVHWKHLPNDLRYSLALETPLALAVAALREPQETLVSEPPQDTEE